MELLLGPILYAKDQLADDSKSQNTWSFLLNVFLGGTDPNQPLPLKLCFTDAQGEEVFSSQEARPAADFSWLPERSAGVVWRWEVVLSRQPQAQSLKYHFEVPGQPGAYSFTPPSTPDGKERSYQFPAQPLVIDHVVVPSVGTPPNIAFFSCNGAEDGKKWKRIPKFFALWEEMLEEHRRASGHFKKTPGFQLLIGGGDQLYADSLWSTMTELKQLRKQSNTLKQPVPQGFADRVMAEYVGLYRERWNGTEGIAPMLARVPGLFTWDDHDIFDGWGSHEDLQGTPWFKQIYSAAARAFEAFQLGRLAQPQTLREPDIQPWDSKHPRHYFQTLSLTSKDCDLDVVMLDLRSGRTSQSPDKGKVEHTVMSESQWKAFEDWKEARFLQKAKDPVPRAHHILVVSSVPVVHLRFSSTLERLAGGVSSMRDDMLDQWESLVHRGERTRLIMDLFSLAKHVNAAVTVLSGDVHVAARGRLRSRNPEHLTEAQAVTGEAIIEQVTSSAIGHNAPGPLEFLGMLTVSKDSIEDLPGFLQSELLPVGSDLYLRERNWLALRVEPSQLKQPKLWARWVAEESVLPMEVVVTPPRPLPPKEGH
ncbi:alkaline phosphatase D family protein [Corallococcus carmarthensis]|nr:alkaline phosphatase D family protein [Corallococcus carmarthensis]